VGNIEGSLDSLLDSMDPQQEEDDGDEDSFWFALKIVLIVYNCCKQKALKKIAFHEKILRIYDLVVQLIYDENLF
jgi:hypothetical protein